MKRQSCREMDELESEDVYRLTKRMKRCALLELTMHDDYLSVLKELVEEVIQNEKRNNSPCKKNPIREVTELGLTSLHVASRNGHLAIAKILLEVDEGIAVITENVQHRTALHIAAEEGHLNMCKLLLHYHVPINATDKNGNTALHLASGRDKCSVVSLLLENGLEDVGNDTDGFTALHMAVMRDHINVLSVLVQNGSDVNAQCLNGRTPLSYACERGNLEIVLTLIQNGADLNVVDSFKQTAFDYAVAYNHIDVCEFIESLPHLLYKYC